MSFNDIDNIAMGQGYMINDERRLLALTINLMNLISFNRGDTYLYFDEIYNEIIKNTEELSSEEFQYILLKLKKLDKIVIKGDRYYLKELYDAEVYITDRLYRMNEEERRKLPKLDKKINQ